MKLSDKEVQVLVLTINPMIERYREYIAEGSGDANDKDQFMVLLGIQDRLEVWYDTIRQLERE